MRDAGSRWTSVHVLLLLATAHASPTLTSPPDQSATDRCSGGYVTGTCTSYLHKWYYDVATGTCKTFIYGGCAGSGNRFDSEPLCLHACVGGDHTLPPYLQPRLPPPTTPPPPVDDQTVELPPSWTWKSTSPPPPIPADRRGAALTFEETGHHKVFMFAHSNTFIQLDANRIPNFQLRLCREIAFKFRTRLPHGLLVYHSVKDRPDSLDPYALYIIVENGQLKVVHVFGTNSTSLTVGQGLNRDEWHHVNVKIDVHRARLHAEVDDERVETAILGLHVDNNYGVLNDLTSVVLVGGLSSEEKLHGVKYIIESFVGCIKDMTLSAGKAASELLPIKPLIATKHENVVEGCVDKCDTKDNLCFVGSKCVNHYNSLTCDCFGTNYEGEQCDIYAATTLTLRGSSYISYRVYDWKDRVKSSSNRISMFFKTRFDDSALFYASGEPYKHHYIAASIKNKTVHVEIDFGDGAQHVTIGREVTGDYWTNLTIAHYLDTVDIHLDGETKSLDLPGTHHHLYIDPEIYIGGGPDLANRKGLASTNNFAGCLQRVFFNDISIIYELNRANPKVHYIGVLEPEIFAADVETIPITFAFPSSHIWWPNIHEDRLQLAFDFRSSRPMATLASSAVTSADGNGYWELRLVNNEIRFELVPDVTKNTTHITVVKFDSKSAWHKVELKYVKDELKLSVDYKHSKAQIFSLQFRLGHNITIATGIKINTGLVGCMRDIEVNGEQVESRGVVRSKHIVGEISLDNCMLVDPCVRPNKCEHGGKCSVMEDKVMCDCTGTGYIGNSCHFAEYRKTCEELALLGYTKPAVYLIDIDGNGPFPPAHVKCEFQSFEESTKTIVEHNLPSQIDVRSPTEGDFSFSITYREFSAEMLQELISHSLNCSQHIKYDCYKAPLELHSATWFQSSANRDIVDHIATAKRGACPCAANRTCVTPGQACNCDVSEAKWHSDEGDYTHPDSLGITEMFFLQQKDLGSDAQGRITLGPLECVETNTQQYVVTFTSSQSYIEVPGWRKGDISFSFRTTGEKAILLYQPPIRPHHPSFMVALTSDFHLSFTFTLNNGGTREMRIKSQRRLNGGEWQKIWIDYNEQHVRFMINTDYEMVNLLPDQTFGPFEGSMFIGGATEDMLRNSSVRQGLIGCFRGLVVNGEILDIYSYMSVHLSEIIKDCKPSCDPNPCKNGAVCRELWSSYQCVCANPWAHVGSLCETNINSNGLTFIAPEAFIKRNFFNLAPSADKTQLIHVLQQNILVNVRTYEPDALVLYANDHLNNFVSLHLRGGKFVVFAFNVGDVIHDLVVEYPGINSGKSLQLAVIRAPAQTTLHVNERSNTTHAPIQLLTEYSNRPWSNPEREILGPHRPPAPPSEYFEASLGGYDNTSLLVSSEAQQLTGFVGCIRGLKIGEELIDLPAQIQYTVKQSVNGVRAGCTMKCDEVPCKNEGICLEDFLRGEITCNCEHTSYYGDFCATEKGADFGGESSLRRKYVLESDVAQVKVQLAFSSGDQRQQRSVLLLLQTDVNRKYHLLVALTAEGHLVVEEDNQGVVTGTTVKDRHFINGARHSVFYQRNDNTTRLLIDREEVVMTTTSLQEGGARDEGDNQVQVGGFFSDDPRLLSYKGYSGCLSNVFVEVNNVLMTPLDEYMLFTKSEVKVDVDNAAGVRSAQCADFDVVYKPKSGLSVNKSLLQGISDAVWVEDPPTRVAFKSLHSGASEVESGSTQAILLVLSALFVAVVFLGCIVVYKNNKKHKKRKEAETEAAISWQKGQPVKYTPEPVSMTSYKPLNGHQNGAGTRPIVRSSYQPPPTEPPADEQRPLVTDAEVTWEPVFDDDTQPLRQSLEDLSHNLHASIAEEDEEEAEEELLDIPTFPKPGDGERPHQGAHNTSTRNQEEAARNRDSLRNKARVEPALVPGASLSPVFLGEEQRTYGNPISYLGGPRLHYPNTTRASKESVLSLD